MIKKTVIQKRFGFLFLLLTQVMIVGYGNNKEYYENLLNLAENEYNDQNYAKSLEYLVELKVYAKNYNQNSLQIVVLDMMGTVYRDLLDYEKSIECYLEAHQRTMESPNNKGETVNLFNKISILYLLSNNLDKANEYFEKAYLLAIELQDSIQIIRALNNLSLVSNGKGDLEQTVKYLNIVAEIMRKYPVNAFWTLALQYIKTEYLYLKAEYDSAEQLALEALEHDFGKELLSRELEVEYLLVVSKIYHQKKDYPKAVSYAKKALEKSFKLPMTINIYSHLSEVYRATGSLSLVVQCQDSIIRIKNSLTEFSDMNKILRGQIQFDLNNMEKEMVENKEKQRRNQIVSVSVLVFIVMLFLLLFYIRSIKNKQLKIVAEMERKTYKNEIEQKNKELVSQTLLQLSKNAQIEEIITMLSQAPNQEGNLELQSIIQKLHSQLKNPVDENWNSFLRYFEQTNSVFLSALKSKHPNLTADEIRLSSYIYLHLDTKEIAKLLHITPESCQKKKRRLAKKMKLPPTTIHGHLSNIV